MVVFQRVKDEEIENDFHNDEKFAIDNDFDVKYLKYKVEVNYSSYFVSRGYGGVIWIVGII